MEYSMGNRDDLEFFLSRITPSQLQNYLSQLLRSDGKVHITSGTPNPRITSSLQPPAQAKTMEKFVKSMEKKRSSLLQTFWEQKGHITDLLGTKGDTNQNHLIK